MAIEGITFSKEVHPEDREETAPNTKNYAPFQKSNILKKLLGKGKREGKYNGYCQESILE